MSDLVFVRADSPEALAEKERVPYVLPGEGGGKMIKHPNGTVVGPVGGEALRHALLRGAVIVGDAPAKVTVGKSVPEQQNQAQREEVAKNQEVKSRGIYDGYCGVGISGAGSSR